MLLTEQFDNQELPKELKFDERRINPRDARTFPFFILLFF